MLVYNEDICQRNSNTKILRIVFYYGLSHLTRFFICHITFFWGNYVDILSLQCTISNKISSNENIKLNKKESEHQD